MFAVAAGLRWCRFGADASRALADALGVTEIPTLVLLRDRRAVACIEGRATALQIDAMISVHLPDGEEALGICVPTLALARKRRHRLTPVVPRQH